MSRPNKRIKNKKNKKTALMEQAMENAMKRFLDENMKNDITDFSEKLADLDARADMENEVMQLFYKEFVALKSREEKEHIRRYIRLREETKTLSICHSDKDKCFDMDRIGMEALLCEIDEILADVGVTVVEVNIGDTFDPKLHKAVRKSSGTEAGAHEKIITAVESDAYIWDEITIVPAKVEVGGDVQNE